MILLHFYTSILPEAIEDFWFKRYPSWYPYVLHKGCEEEFYKWPAKLYVPLIIVEYTNFTLVKANTLGRNNSTYTYLVRGVRKFFILSIFVLHICGTNVRKDFKKS